MLAPTDEDFDPLWFSTGFSENSLQLVRPRTGELTNNDTIITRGQQNPFQLRHSTKNCLLLPLFVGVLGDCHF